MQTIREVVEKLVQKLKVDSEENLKESISLLKKDLTIREFKHIKNISLKDKILYLAIDSQVWLAHFNLKKDRILEGLKERLNLKEIKISLARDDK
ncbi:MAG: DciA family protein [Candidatus Omnitrophica bacterium]|nr:DciA family protein [Candidatus Omnitrophota bacterium]